MLSRTMSGAPLLVSNAQWNENGTCGRSAWGFIGRKVTYKVDHMTRYFGKYIFHQVSGSSSTPIDDDRYDGVRSSQMVHL